MARTAAGSELTGQHRQAQLRVRAQALQDYSRIWPLWQGDSTSFLRLVDASAIVVQTHRRVSSALAAAYFDAFRKAEKIRGSARARLDPGHDPKKFAGGMFVNGEKAVRDAIHGGRSAGDAMATALVRTSGTVGRFVLEGGRQTTLLSVTGDREAKGYARVTSGNPCAFCALIASRGPVFGEESGDFEAHDHCACSVEPAYADSEWPGRAREFAELYDQHAAGAASGDEAFSEFRRALSA